LRESHTTKNSRISQFAASRVHDTLRLLLQLPTSAPTLRAGAVLFGATASSIAVCFGARLRTRAGALERVPARPARALARATSRWRLLKFKTSYAEIAAAGAARPALRWRPDQRPQPRWSGHCFDSLRTARCPMTLGMLQRALPTGFIAPCLPTKQTARPRGHSGCARSSTGISSMSCSANVRSGCPSASSTSCCSSGSIGGFRNAGCA